MKSQFKQKLVKKIYPELAKKLGIKKFYELPRIEKIIVNVGMAKIRDVKETVQKIAADIEKITGQKPKFIKSKRSIAEFKLRTGETVAMMTTLRNEKMYEFLYKLINFALPAVRDFKGLNAKFDSHGNFNLGIREYAVFPEIMYENVTHIQSIGINICVKAKKVEYAKKLLEVIGLPVAKQ
ncbi:MAG: large subunit ribosomal protein L5 [Candidatus Berkelbacteria bacterium Licking1014_7]|uniref:Large ribosomal subunit protein uL5 n=1 Tax=Candidatus Berkelbacteria bacterium Licking1014_7 TaxID=2017147 RepID=A0A554LKH7_9BACT|nr:MAG: large subunit ribosomal protein L5 [Candidatus Berkelbacteria bacterium Licking1014_7]